MGGVGRAGLGREGIVITPSAGLETELSWAFLSAPQALCCNALPGPEAWGLEGGAPWWLPKSLLLWNGPWEQDWKRQLGKQTERRLAWTPVILGNPFLL